LVVNNGNTVSQGHLCILCNFLSKAGKVHIHMGGDKAELQLLWNIVKNTAIPITQFVPTHMTRNASLIKEGKSWVGAGGWLDFTADEEGHSATLTSILEYLTEGRLLNTLTVSSDAFGSFPTFNEKGELIHYGVAKPTSLLALLRKLHKIHKCPWETVLPLFTTNPAACYCLQSKGKIENNFHADLLVLEKESLELSYVFAKGKILKSPGWTAKAMFEN